MDKLFFGWSTPLIVSHLLYNSTFLIFPLGQYIFNILLRCLRCVVSSFSRSLSGTAQRLVYIFWSFSGPRGLRANSLAGGPGVWYLHITNLNTLSTQTPWFGTKWFQVKSFRMCIVFAILAALYNYNRSVKTVNLS